VVSSLLRSGVLFHAGNRPGDPVRHSSASFPAGLSFVISPLFLQGAALYEALTYAGYGKKIGSWLPMGSLGLDGAHSPVSCIANPAWMTKNLAVLSSPARRGAFLLDRLDGSDRRFRPLMAARRFPMGNG